MMAAFKHGLEFEPSQSDDDLNLETTKDKNLPFAEWFSIYYASVDKPTTTSITEPENPIPWPDPSPEELETPEFEAIWQAIKTWDINVPGAYGGYCGATGNHVKAILNALQAV